MVVSYQKVWRTMNDLEMVTSKVCSVREIIDCASEALSTNDRNRAETLMNAAHELLGYYLEEFDAKFKDAWGATVGDLRTGDVKKEFDTCDVNDTSEYCQKSWNDFWEKDNQYTEEELDAMCDKASHDQEKKLYNIDPKGNEVPVKKWVLPIEEDSANNDLYVTFPEDLLSSVNLKEGDWVNWVENGDGTWTLKKA